MNRPLVITTTLGAFATIEYTPEMIATVVESGKVLTLSAGLTCRVHPKDDGIFSFIPIIVTEMTDKLWIPTNAIGNWYYSDLIGSAEELLSEITRAKSPLDLPVKSGRIIQLGDMRNESKGSDSSIP